MSAVRPALAGVLALAAVMGTQSGPVFAAEASRDPVQVLRLLGGKGAAGLSAIEVTRYRLTFKRK